MLWCTALFLRVRCEETNLSTPGNHGTKNKATPAQLLVCHYWLLWAFASLSLVNGFHCLTDCCGFSE